MQAIFENILQQNRYVNEEGFTLQRLQSKKASNEEETVLTEQNVRKMYTALNKHELKVFTNKSAKSLNYEQIMGCIGKLTMR